VGRVEVIVIDTHVMVWWTMDTPRQLSTAARRSLIEADVVAFSAVSLWEVGVLARRGRIDLKIHDWLPKVTGVYSLVVLPVTLDIAIRAAEFHELLRDPIDCLIAATALTHNAALITKDDPIRASGVVETIW
jgi:PIN domain nuclease of toxin-antitoxin system